MSAPTYLVPPAGSRLERYVQHLNQVFDQAQEQEPGRGRRLKAVSQMLKNRGRLDLPTSVVRDHFVLPALEELGLPKGKPAPWLEALIAEYAEVARRAALPACPCHASGRPSKWDRCLAAMSAAYIETLGPGQSDDERYEIVANRLGPGVGAADVRHAARAFRRRLAALDQNWQDAALLATMQVRDILREFDAHEDGRVTPPVMPN